MRPVLVTVLFSCPLFFFHLYYFRQAGALSGSSWLVAFAGGFHRAGASDLSEPSIHYWYTLLEGSFLVFFRGGWLFDSSIWTMHPELVGSFLAFGMALILLEARKSSAFVVIGLIAIAVVLLYFSEPELAAFPVGVGLAVLLPQEGSWSPKFAFPALLLSLYLLGYPGSAIGAYTMFGFLASHSMPFTYPQIVGAAILIGAIEGFPSIRRSLSGKISAFMGDLSFPIYLLHTLVICSVGSKVYLSYGAVPAIIAVFVVSILASLPVMRFNNWCMARVNSLTDFLLLPRHTIRQGSRIPYPGVVATAPNQPAVESLDFPSS
jgi:peptidoglycan/LPS O-acetylase OafA/YrhL